MPSTETVYYYDGTTHQCMGVDAQERIRNHPDQWSREPFSKEQVAEGKKQIAKIAADKEKAEKDAKGTVAVSAPEVPEGVIQAAVDKAVSAALAERDAQDAAKAKTEEEAAAAGAAKTTTNKS